MTRRNRQRSAGTLSLSGDKSMDPGNSNGHNGQVPVLKEKTLVAIPVEGGASGEGLPYAPEDWPCVGDKWRWRVGKRASHSGYWKDRYLYPPPRLTIEKGGKQMFPSRLLVEKFIIREFPDADVKAFFASFIWKIPSHELTPGKALVWFEEEEQQEAEEEEEEEEEEEQQEAKMTKRKREPSPGTLSLSGDKSLDPDNSNWSNGQVCLMPAEATTVLKEKNLVAIPVEAGASGEGLPYAPEDWPCVGDKWRWRVGKRASPAGYWSDRYLYLPPRLVREKGRKQMFTSRLLVEQFISGEFPDADVKAFFTSFIWKIPSRELTPEKDLLWFDQSIGSSKIEDELDQVLKDLAVPDPTISQNYLNVVHGIETSFENELTDGNAASPVYITSDHNIASAKIEDEIGQVLKVLKRSQESELRIVHDKLHSQKDYLLSLYQQLESERAELANSTSPGSNPDCLLTSVLNRVDEIKQEEQKLRDMMQISKGFGQAPNSIHQYYFGSSS